MLFMFKDLVIAVTNLYKVYKQVKVQLFPEFLQKFVQLNKC